MAAKPKISDSTAIQVETIVADQPDLVLSFGGETKTVDMPSWKPCTSTSWIFRS